LTFTSTEVDISLVFIYSFCC